jgi:hypothetical protein
MYTLSGAELACSEKKIRNIKLTDQIQASQKGLCSVEGI